MTLELSGLNSQQYEAVTSDSQNLLVLAGAGSGKTRVLTHRIGWLVEQGLASPYSVLAVTFTNKAAKEIKTRLGELLQTSVSSLWCGTFHSLAHRLLQSHWEQAGLMKGFQVLDADDQLRLVKRIMSELNITDDRIQPKQVQWFINGQKDEGRRAQYVVPHQDWSLKVYKEIYVRYEQLCQSSGLVDFAELLLRAHELWLNNAEVLQHYQRQFTHVLVDEFQDINDIQFAWLQVLVASGLSLTVVGDDDQSIYGWRGAKVENIQKFDQTFAEVKTIRLEQNYRSTATILAAANAVISNNVERLGKRLWTNETEGEAINLYAGFNEQDEARYVADDIQGLNVSGVSLSQVAVLYRSNAQSRVLEEALVQRQIPYRIYGGVRFYDRMEIKNSIAYLRLVMNHHDDAAFERVLNFPPRGIGNKSAERLRALAREHQVSLWAAAQMTIENSWFAKRAHTSLKAFFDLILKLRQLILSCDQLEEVISTIHNQSGLVAYHQKEAGEKARARVENLNELISAAQAYAENECETGVSIEALVAEFLVQVSLDSGEAQADEFVESVQLMTLHSAKGLEFDYVYLVGMEENLFPHKMSVSDLGGVQEERRLAYVGITRARRKLTLSCAESRRLFGSEARNRVSRFVKEIPSELLSEVRLRSSVSRSVDLALQAEMPDGAPFKLGQAVMHPRFGEGVVMACEGVGAQAKVHVNFSDGAQRKLLIAYAKLEAV